MKKTPLFNLFWENTKLNRERSLVLAESITLDAEVHHTKPKLEYPDELIRLPLPKDRLQNALTSRCSIRQFSHDGLSLAHLGSLFAGLAMKSDGFRVWPSGGAKYPVEAFAVLLRAPTDLQGRIVYYNADNHSFSTVATACPDWTELASVFSFSAAPPPAAIIILVGFPARTTEKYGERGARFVLMEGGICMQNLSLRAAESGLAGVLLGGLHDEAIKTLLQLEDTEAIILGGYACGLPVPAPKRGFFR